MAFTEKERPRKDHLLFLKNHSKQIPYQKK